MVGDEQSRGDATTLYERVGGSEFFVELVERFYASVENDEILRPLYPEDLHPGKQHLAMFLAQLWGGPQSYSIERGHPRLRQRHFPFPIRQAERDAWVTHMLSALHTMSLADDDALVMSEYFARTATLMMNRL